MNGEEYQIGDVVIIRPDITSHANITYGEFAGKEGIIVEKGSGPKFIIGFDGENSSLVWCPDCIDGLVVKSTPISEDDFKDILFG